MGRRVVLDDAVSAIGYLAAVTERVQLGTGILNVFSRSATAIAQTASGLDTVSGGRFVLGLGASGPQVIEGFHGIPYEKPMSRIREYIEVVRMTLRRERVVHDGTTVKIPLPEGQGTGLGKPLKIINHPVRDEIPIWWASLMSRSVEETARVADGWLPIQMVPERLRDVWGDALDRGLADRPPELGTLQISAPAAVAIGDEYAGDAADPILDQGRPGTALYWGGMGARGKNFYNDVASAMGYADEARHIQDLYLDGEKEAAAAAVPTDFLRRANLVGPESQIAERLRGVEGSRSDDDQHPAPRQRTSPRPRTPSEPRRQLLKLCLTQLQQLRASTACGVGVCRACPSGGEAARRGSRGCAGTCRW